MSWIMGQIRPGHPELFALEFGKIAENDFFYTLASTNINQSEPNLVKNVCDHKFSDEFDCLYRSIYKSRPISTNHGHNTYDNEILDEFNYGSNPTATS